MLPYRQNVYEPIHWVFITWSNIFLWNSKHVCAESNLGHQNWVMQLRNVYKRHARFCTLQWVLACYAFFFQENEIFFQNTHINSTIERQTRCKFYNVILCTLSYYISSENHMVHHITCDQYNEKVQTLMKAST